MTKREKIGLAVATGILAFVLNRAFLQWVSLSKILAMNDVPAILTGYRQTPNLFLDGLRWWRGTWIQDGIHAYRPLASYLYWIESFIGLRRGFVWVGLIGVLLLASNALLSGVLAWRFTRSKACVCFACGLGVSMRFWNWSGATPDYWLAWYPVHQELLMNAFLLLAIFYFDLWRETAASKNLRGVWLFFGLGIFTKEHVYIFPVFALAIALLGKNARAPKKQMLLHAALMLMTVLVLWFYRASILIDPRNPQLKTIMLIRKPWLFLAFPFYPFILTYQFWFPGLALLLFGLAGVLICWRRGARRAWLQKPFVPLATGIAVIVIIAIYCQLFYTSAPEAFWYLCEPSNEFIRLQQLVVLTLSIYWYWLLWKYRKTEPTALAFACLVLCYVPVITYLGWHYTAAAWFVRSAYWAVILKCAWLDVAPILQARVPIKILQLPLWARWKSSPA